MPTKPQVQAVLDWELSTLGDPMADFTYLLMQWMMPGARPGADLHGAEHSDDGRGRRDLLQGDGPSDHPGPELVFLLQPVPARRHPAGHRRAHPRRHRRQREGAETAARACRWRKASWEYAQKAGASVEQRTSVNMRVSRAARAATLCQFAAAPEMLRERHGSASARTTFDQHVHLGGLPANGIEAVSPPSTGNAWPLT